LKPVSTRAKKTAFRPPAASPAAAKEVPPSTTGGQIGKRLLETQHIFDASKYREYSESRAEMREYRKELI